MAADGRCELEVAPCLGNLGYCPDGRRPIIALGSSGVSLRDSQEPMRPSMISAFHDSCERLADVLSSEGGGRAKRILREIETAESVSYELEHSVETLRGFRDEFSNLSSPLRGLTVSTFFPLNQPLYHLVLMAIAPAAFANHVFVRVPEVLRDTLPCLVDELEIRDGPPKISFHLLPRHAFRQMYVADSDVIVFTGRFENAVALNAGFPRALMVFNGCGYQSVPCYVECRR